MSLEHEDTSSFEDNIRKVLSDRFLEAFQQTTPVIVEVSYRMWKSEPLFVLQISKQHPKLREELHAESKEESLSVNRKLRPD